ncbi:MAG: Inner rane component of cytoplasmic domain, partial [Myxococcales bacterium]|nr:Inner rane component of cytoplasmic domain [Myxococcales bacterium]
MAPVLEFFGGKREPFPISSSEVYIGRGAACTLRLDAAGAAERHARLTVDGAGNVFIQDLDTHSGTLRNDNFVYGVQQLADGDKIEIGGMALLFRARAAAAQAPAPLAAAPLGAAPP